jgi:membrane protein implicated in regulation of membrane protease activity
MSQRGIVDWAVWLIVLFLVGELLLPFACLPFLAPFLIFSDDSSEREVGYYTLAVVACVIVLIWYFRKRKKRDQNLQNKNDEQPEEL